MKRLISLALVLILCFCLFACGENDKETPPVQSDSVSDNEDLSVSHTHDWKSATCTTPKTCSTCGATEGDATGHTYKNATCVEPKTCSVCGATDGKANGHNWNAATCDTPKTCSVCGVSEGNANGHTWKSATCTAPKTCSECGTTDGKPTDHKYSGGTCTMCGVADPSDTSEEMVWIPTKGGTKYHKNQKCSNMKNPEQVAKSNAESQGFTPCKKCYG